MELLLLLVAAAPGSRASKLAALTRRATRLVLASLRRLEGEGLVSHTVVAGAGPLGTYAWSATPAGHALVEDVLAAIRRGAP